MSVGRKSANFNGSLGFPLPVRVPHLDPGVLRRCPEQEPRVELTSPAPTLIALMARTLPLILSLLLTFAFAVASLGVLINAFVKFHHDLARLREVTPSGAVVKVDNHTILDPGKVSTAINALLIALSLASLLSVVRYPSSKIILLLALAIGFSSVWLLATTIAITVTYATKSAKVSASLDGISIPQSTINGVAKRIGLSPVYKDLWYIRVAAIVPWFAFLFASIAAVLMLHHWSASKKEGLTHKGAEEHERNLKDELSHT